MVCATMKDWSMASKAGGKGKSFNGKGRMEMRLRHEFQFGSSRRQAFPARERQTMTAELHGSKSD